MIEVGRDDPEMIAHGSRDCPLLTCIFRDSILYESYRRRHSTCTMPGAPPPCCAQRPRDRSPAPAASRGTTSTPRCRAWRARSTPPRRPEQGLLHVVHGRGARYYSYCLRGYHHRRRRQPIIIIRVARACALCRHILCIPRAARGCQRWFSLSAAVRADANDARVQTDGGKLPAPWLAGRRPPCRCRLAWGLVGSTA